MLVLMQVLTAVLALSNYCDFLTYGNDHHRDTSYPTHGDFLIATNSGITFSVRSVFRDRDYESLAIDFPVGETPISDTVTKLSTVWTATDSDNPPSPTISIEIAETSEGIIQHEPTNWTEQPTTNSPASTEVQTESTIVNAATTAMISSSTLLVTTSNLASNVTSPFAISPTTDRIRRPALFATPGSILPTTPPMCGCDSMKLILGTLDVGNYWFAVPFSSTSDNPQCILENLTGLNVTVKGPFDKDDQNPEITQYCFSPITCLNGNNNSFLFNSSVCCENSVKILQCSNYDFSMTPQYSTCAGRPDLAYDVIFTRPGPDATPKNVTVRDTGSDWVSMSWQDLQFCEKTLTSYFMRYDPLYSKGGNSSINIEVPLTCINRSFVDGMTDFNSKTCPEIFSLKSCTNYSVAIEVEIYDRYNSQPSESVSFNTKTPENLVAQIDEKVESGSDWLAFQWNLSAPQCQTVTNGFRFNLTNLRNNSYETYDCNITDQPTVDSKFVFNTSSNDCDRKVNVTPCSDYEIVVIPKILNLLYDGSRDSALGRTTCEPITAFVIFIDSGSDWISFNWTTSIEDCRKVLTGFWLSIASTEQGGKQDALQFISMEDCYCNLKEDQAIMFNTSTVCQNWINPDIVPCSEYDISIIPQFFGSLNGSAGPFNKTSTLPDDGITPLTQNAEAGKNWISFEWQASTTTCRDIVTGLWISMNRSVPYLCPINATDDKFITFNTSSTCFNKQNLSPCSRYTFEIQLDIHGKIGQSSKVNQRTTPGDDATALIDDKQYGVNWISFRWQSSVPECQSFVTGYHLNVTDVFNGTSQFRNLSLGCSIITDQHEWVFNSTLPCTQLEIFPCSNYSVSLAPVFRTDNRTVINGVSAFIGIGTQSGNLGEIEHPNVVSQGTNSLTLTWIEPTCRKLSYYNVTVIPDWNLEPRSEIGEKYLIIYPDCLEKHSNGNVSLILNDTTCRSGYNFVSCAPYNISVLPFYELSSANENLVGWTDNTQTLPFPYEASVNNLTVQDVGAKWMSISWPIPTCRVPVSEWILSESESIIVLPPDCPAYVNGSLTLNISDTIICTNSDTPIQSEVPLIPCTNYSLGMNVKYSNLEVQNGSNNVILSATAIEPPGLVRNLTSHGTSNSVLLEWAAPEKNPQCVKGYQVKWNNQEIFTTKQHILIESLEPCSMFPVTVNALPDLSIKMYESQTPVIVSTNSVDPAPVVSDINVVKLQNEWTRNVSWLKPEVDYCISGYNVSIKKATSTDIIYNVTLQGKETTWTTLNEGFEKGNLYTISVSSFCSFKRQISSSNYTTHAFTWDSASNMINVTAVVCSIIFPILAFAIFYAILLIRKSKGSVLAPEKYLPDNRSTPIRKSPPLNSQRPVVIRELRSTIDWLEADSRYELSNEYESIKSMSNKTATCTVAKLPENEAKNRYVDILPYDHSRVRLATVPPLSDYINASDISGYTGQRAYIATQGPKPSTIEDFWLMCFDQNVKIIVALTQLEERGRIKCAQYWPSTGSSEYGSIRVELTNEVKESNYIVRDFWLTKISSNGKVATKFTKQMHFTEWPDFGCPENPEVLINFVHAMRNKSISLYRRYRVTCPIVVHCSAGVGRTGTLIGLDILMEQARCKKMVDVMNTVVKLRNERCRMVQTEEQYLFLYKCVYTYACNELPMNKLTRNSPSKLTKYQSSDSIALTPLSFLQKDPFANNFSRKSSFTAV